MKYISGLKLHQSVCQRRPDVGEKRIRDLRFIGEAERLFFVLCGVDFKISDEHAGKLRTRDLHLRIEIDLLVDGISIHQSQLTNLENGLFGVALRNVGGRDMICRYKNAGDSGINDR